MDKESIRLALTRVAHPSGSGDLVAVGAVTKIAYCDGYASVTIAGGGMHDDQRRGVIQQSSAAVRLAAQQRGVEIQDVHVEVTDQPPTDLPTGGEQPVKAGQASSGAQQERKPPGRAQEQASALPNVGHILAVGAGKGGVGKSSIAVNLAVGLARRGHAVGLMDGDIYGPSLPTMMGLDAFEVNVSGSVIEPFPVAGVKVMTLGKLVEPEKPLIWRGPMAHGAFKQLAEQTNWGTLDYLIIDLPPGTGDVCLTLAQLFQLAGAVVVCTPQRVAQDDAVRAARMFQQLGIEVLGIVENMSYFVGDDGKEYDIFGRGGAQMMAQRLGLPFLGSVPITMALREHSDAGTPEANFDAGVSGERLPGELETLIKNVESQVRLASLRSGAQKPTLSIN